MEALVKEQNLESWGVAMMEMEGRTFQMQERSHSKDRSERTGRVWELLSNGNVNWRNYW